jgi:hypothetical protein
MVCFAIKSSSEAQVNKKFRPDVIDIRILRAVQKHGYLVATSGGLATHPARYKILGLQRAPLST